MSVLCLLCLVSQYRPGLMAQVVVNRQVRGGLSRDLPVTDGFVAVLDCGRIGEVMWMAPIGEEWESFLIVDCAVPDDSDGTISWMMGDNVWDRVIIAEIDYTTAVRWRTVGKMKLVELRHRGPRLSQ